ncbi:hypothetical protein A8C56_22295 [Niabella ginsenosidivorans]|uniref:SIMPL domain-containing protein n=1 Tax=Niabella ginsenosidivorans TaxID=1176587 RepID=A0A1A9I9F2_9BACT|nr:SIMPL domain-containing protein [Niabella ginsenosidivorans]ANH83350.1 hypothetical protein A8C56_22295 [Niabella ginsenosidivorans]
MKQLFAAALLSLVTLGTIKAQTPDLRRKISVSGTAETEVTPDIIYVSISLKEYFENGNNKKRVDISTLENQLYAAAQKAGIAKENLTISNLNSWTNTSGKKKNPDFLASRQYLLKVSDLNKLDQIISSIDSRGIQSTGIQSYDYSKMEQLKKELKIKALQAAKEKASYMVAALDGKLGDVLEIQDSGDSPVQPVLYRNYAMKAEAADTAGGDADLDFKKIKLSFTVNTVFEIK